MFHFGTTFRKFNIFFANIVATKPKKSHPPGAMTRNSLAAAMFGCSEIWGCQQPKWDTTSKTY
jgi:hypothetical protein